MEAHRRTGRGLGAGTWGRKMKEYWDAFDRDYETVKYMPVTTNIARRAAEHILEHFRTRYLTLMAYQAAFIWGG